MSRMCVYVCVFAAFPNHLPFFSLQSTLLPSGGSAGGMRPRVNKLQTLEAKVSFGIIVITLQATYCVTL